MKKISWSVEKNRLLRADPDRNICFEDVVVAIEAGGLLDDIEHPNREKYPHQRMLVVQLGTYVYGVPYVEDEQHGLFLKTAFPSRTLKRLYLKDDDDE